MFESLLNNQFLVGGVIVSIGVWAKELPVRALKELKDQFLCQITLEDKCNELSGLQEWVSGRLRDKRTRQIFQTNHMRVAPGTYWAGFYNKVPLWIDFSRTESKSGGYSSTPVFRDKYTLTFLTRNHKILSVFAAELREIYQNMSKKGTIEVFSADRDGYYDDSVDIKARSLDSVVLPNTLKSQIVADIENFKSKEEWYSKIGVPWRRGYMLYGPPGNGKSSLVSALAGKYGARLKVINLSNLANDSALQQAFSSAKNHDFVLVEDADCITREGATNFSLSTLLNAIDGVGARDGRILFLTTNSPESLDAALVRPGRLDRKFHIQNATKEQAFQLYYRFFGKAPEHLTIEDYQYSMAELQERFLEEVTNAQN